MLANRVREYTTTTGTGDITLSGAIAAHIRFADAFAAGDSITYVIEDGDNYEIGVGKLVDETTFERTTVGETLVGGVYDKDAPDAINLSGNARVYCAATAEFLLDPTEAADIIREVTPDAGVTVDGVILKDGGGTFADVVTINDRLDIRGSSNSWFTFRDTTATANYGTFRKTDGSALGYIGGGAGAAISGGTQNDLALRSQGALYLATGGNSTRLAISSTGDVGIGSFVPQAKLDVYSSGSNIAKLSRSAGAGWIELFEGTTRKTYFGFEALSGGGGLLSGSEAGATVLRGMTGPIHLAGDGVGAAEGLTIHGSSIDFRNIMTLDSFGMHGQHASGAPVYGGGSSPILGANIQMFAESHTTSAGDMNFRNNSTSWMYYDASLNNITFAGNLVVQGGGGSSTGGLHVLLGASGTTHFAYGTNDDNYITRGNNGFHRLRAANGDTDVEINGTQAEFRRDIVGSGATFTPFKMQWERSDGGAGSKRWVQYVGSDHRMLIGRADDAGALTSEYFSIASDGSVSATNSLSVTVGGLTGVGQRQYEVRIPDVDGMRGGFGVSNVTGGSLAGIAAQQVDGGVYPNSIGRLDVWVQNGAVTKVPVTFNADGTTDFNGRVSIDGNGTAPALMVDGASRDIGVASGNGFQIGHWDGTTWTERLLIDSFGNSYFSGSVSAGNNESFRVRGSQNAFRGIVPETDINLMLGTGSGDQPRIYLYGADNGQANAGDIFIGTANNIGSVNVSGKLAVSSELSATRLDVTFKGNAALPSLRVDSDGTGSATGLFGSGDSGSEFLGFSTAGVEALRLDAGQNASFSGEIVTSNGLIRRNVNTGTTVLTGGLTGSQGGAVYLYGSAHSTFANDIAFLSAGGTKLHFDASSDWWDYQSKQLKNVGNITMSGSQILRSNSSGQLFLSGGPGAATGSNIVLHGSGHVNANDILFRTGSATRMQWYAAGNFWTFAGNQITNAPLITRGDAASFLEIGGGSATTGSGGNILLYGPSHASKAYDVEIRGGTGVELHIDTSANTVNMMGNTVLAKAGAGADGAAYRSFVQDNEYIIQSYNSSASNAAQFNIRHNLGSVILENLRGSIEFPTAVRQGGRVFSGSADELTISSGSITVTKNYHAVDTESDAPTDDLTTINGGVAGMRLVLTGLPTSRDITIKASGGNLRLNNNSDFTIVHVNDTIELIFNGTNWTELSRSNNG